MQLLLKENTKIALESIRAQLLRSILTVLIIAIGITALVGILTAIDAIKQSINSNFTSMGANTFTIRNRESTIRIGKKGKRPKRYREITYAEATLFKNKSTSSSVVSISAMGSGASTLKYGSKKTNPNIAIFGGDENYVTASGNELSEGRPFSIQEIQYSGHVVIIGTEIATTLFGTKKSPINEVISIGSGKYKVIGVLKSKGSSMSMGGDKICIIPLNNMRQYFGGTDISYVISVLSDNPGKMESAIGEATGLFRRIRRVALGEDDNFEIMKSDSLANLLIENISYVTAAATIIGFITLLGAAIGLMNIMLVSVSERTREIGIRKSLGATSALIKNQFLTEAVVICQLGGLLGIILGIAIGNLTSFLVGSGFIVPWIWIISGLLLCFAVGLIAGIYPAIKASKLDPVEALRFE